MNPDAWYCCDSVLHAGAWNLPKVEFSRLTVTFSAAHDLVKFELFALTGYD
jgi:hypothetical protein